MVPAQPPAPQEGLFEFAEQAMARAVRAADEQFERVGGSSRHWIRDCFVPSLAKEGLGIVQLDELNRLQKLARAPLPAEPSAPQAVDADSKEKP